MKTHKKSLRAMELLYSCDPIERVALSPKPKAAQRYKSEPYEDQEQMRFVYWLTKKSILHYHIPNGGNRNRAYAAKLKRLGLSPGVPDICIPIPRKSYHGLYIELKRLHGGVVSDRQQWWMDSLRREGYQVVVAKGCDEAIKAVEVYMIDD